MKRIREEMYGGGGPQPKRLFTSSRPAESYGQSQVAGGGGAGAAQKLTTNDALTYLKEVKDIFHDQREKYDMFLEVMKDFKAQRTDTGGVIARVKELFKGHNNLILGFNTFLPKGYEITLDEDETPSQPKKTVEFEEAISFVNKIKKRFQNDELVYKSFLDILNMYRKEHKDITEVFNEVATLFEDHSDLLEEFTRFLPEASAVPSAQQGSHGRNLFQRYHERSSAVPVMRQVHIGKRRQDRILASHCDPDLGADHPELDDDKAMMKMQREQRRRLEKEARDRRNREQDDRDHEHDSRRDFNVHRFSENRKSSRKVEGFGTSYDDKAVKSMYNYAVSFFEKVKEKLGSLDDYQSFLKCLNMYNNGIVQRTELQNLVTDVMGKYPDLMSEFHDFLERCGNIDGFLAGVINKKSPYNIGHSSRSMRLEDKDKEQKRENEGTREKERYKDKYMGKSIQELDLSGCQRCTPSYRLLPADYPVPTASQRTELGGQVLNDYWVSVTSGSEDYSFKHMRRNQYEESLFRCEDDRFELDMLLESVSSTAKRVEELLKTSNENRRNRDDPTRVEDYFTALNLRCIERLYGDHGLDVIDILHKSPTIALPIIFTRLEQKKEEWMQCRSDFNKIWAEVYAKNHYKSLDHRSFYFKQQDSKNLSTKSLVAEIKELKEKREKEGDLVMDIASRSAEPLIPHLEYEYSDIDIHEDLYKLVEFSCEEVCSTKEQLNKVMRLWTTYLEPMLGVPSRPHRTESDEDVENAGDYTECLASNIGASNGCPDACSSGMTSQQPKSGSTKEEKASIGQVGLCGTSSANGDAVGKEGCSVTPSDLGGSTNEDHEPKTDSELLPSSKVWEAPKSVISTNGVAEGINMDKRHEEAVETLNVEKEEGELSPTGDLEEDNQPGDAGMETVPVGKPSDESRRDQSQNGDEMCEDAGLGSNVDADDEDSENVSEAGEDVSASGSAGDECSREEHEEEDNGHDEVDGKAESEGEAEGMSDGNVVGEDGESLLSSERYLMSVRPLVKHLSTKAPQERKDSRVFYGNDDLYVLFRLHQILYERILSVKTNSLDADSISKTSQDACIREAYARFLSALYNLLDGSIDNAKFEDECRTLYGNQSYVLFTLDKLIFKLIKQLQTVVSDEMDNKLSQLYTYEKSRKVGSFADPVYYENARVLLHEQNIYRLEFSSSPSRLSIQLMDSMIDKPEVFAVSVDPKFGAYLYNDYMSVSSGKKEPQGLMLQRNKRKYAGLDESSVFLAAMEGVQMVNGLECKIACSSSKISYVLDTEDFYYRKRPRKDACGDKTSKIPKSRVERFHKFISACQ